MSTIILDSVLAESLELAWSVHSINVHCCTALLKGFKMKAYKHLVKHSLVNNCLVSVFDGEEWAVNMSGKYQTIIDAIESVEEAQIKIYSKFDTRGEGYKGWALVIPFGLDDDETVADNSDNEFMNSWDDAYNSKV